MKYRLHMCCYCGSADHRVGACPWKTNLRK